MLAARRHKHVVDERGGQGASKGTYLALWRNVVSNYLTALSLWHVAMG